MTGALKWRLNWENVFCETVKTIRALPNRLSIAFSGCQLYVAGLGVDLGPETSWISQSGLVRGVKTKIPA